MEMELTFIATGLVVLVVGVALGFIAEWIFRKENKIGDCDDGK